PFGICVGSNWGGLPIHPQFWAADFGNWTSDYLLFPVAGKRRLDAFCLCADPLRDHCRYGWPGAATLPDEARRQGPDLGIDTGADRAGYHNSLLGCVVGAAIAGNYLHV